MRIAIVGTGIVGRTLAEGFSRAGHEVVIGTRSVQDTAARDEFAGFEGTLLSLADVASGADLVVNATGGLTSLEALSQVTLDGKVLLDVANPLDFSNGFPPTLSVKDTDSLAEQLQRAFPTARVVKSLNTVTASVMVAPDSLPEPTTIFAASDDDEARALVIGLLTELGWTDVVSLPLEAARGLEMWLPLWVRLMGALGTAEFNLRLVR